MRIAVEGCSHGCLDQIYSTILSLDRRQGKTTSLLLLCGDVQTLRNASDLHCLAVPDKYKEMGDFHRYYSGERKAPILTLMIGGNHEASNYLWELYHGGWVAPNIYYLGAAGCVDVGGLTIAGISGIYKSHDYKLGRFEQMPYSHGTVRSIYHTRRYDTFRLHMLSKSASRKPEIVLSHDWPNTVEQHGDVQWLKRKKPFFVDEINTSSLGSPPLWELLQDLRPDYWFSAHLHVRFAALWKHSGLSTEVRGLKQHDKGEIKVEAPARPEEDSIDESVETKVDNAEEMAIDLSDGDGEGNKDAPTNPEQIHIDDDDFDEDPKEMHIHDTLSVTIQEKELDVSSDAGSTRFLALSKCLEGQDFLQILEVPAPFDCDEGYQRKEESEGESGVSTTKLPSFQFNSSWLAITRATHEYLSLEKKQRDLPDEKSLVARVKEHEIWVEGRLKEVTNGKGSNLDIEAIQHFVRTAPATNDPNGKAGGPPPWYTNPQTVALCSLLGIENRINPPPPNPAIPISGETMLNGQVGLSRPPNVSEEEEIRKIEEAAQTAMKRKKLQENKVEVMDDEVEPVTLLDDDEGAARWKEGAG